MGTIRPMKLDDIVALFSWVFVGNTVFILARTTAFVSVIVVIVNSLQFQEYMAHMLSDYLTRSTGFQITFESAIVPRWREGTLSLENVKIVCTGDTWRDLVRKTRHFNQDDLDDIDVNWTYWDLVVERIDVTLSLWRFMDGRGPVKSVTLNGVRGTVDRRHIQPDPTWSPSRRDPRYGDVELDSLVVHDMLVTVLSNGFRPYSISILNARVPKFRLQWMLYDVMCADTVVGMFDNCLFSIHRPQNLDVFGHGISTGYSKVSHLKISSVPVDHLNWGTNGPLSWITKGTMDMDVYLLIPQTSGMSDGDVVQRILGELDGIREVAMDKLEEVISKSTDKRFFGVISSRRGDVESGDGVSDADSDGVQDVVEKMDRVRVTNIDGARHYGTQHPISTSSTNTNSDTTSDTNAFTDMIMHWRIRLNDLKASVPLITPHLTYMSNALIRPVVAYMNANRTTIPITFTTRMDVNNFNGAWDMYSAGLVDVLEEETGRALIQLVMDERQRGKRLRRIGMWGLQELGKRFVVLVETVRGSRSTMSSLLASHVW